MSSNFISSVVSNIDISSLAGLFIREQFLDQMPVDIEGFDKHIMDVINDAEPYLKEQIAAASDPVFDYLLMESQTLDVQISLEEVKLSLKDKLKQVFLESPPAEFSSIPESLRESYFDRYYNEFAGQIPSTFNIEKGLIGSDVPREISTGLREAETGLEQARQYISYFQVAYTSLLVLMALLVLGIIIISRNVKRITRIIGIPLLTFGIIEYVGVWVARYLQRGQIQFPDIPPHFEIWLYQLIENILKPLETFSLVLLISGAVLVVISFVYRRDESST